MRLGRIEYLNVLPIYNALEKGEIEHDFEITAGPPAELNVLMDAGKLDISAASSIEYARHPEKYYLVPELAIGSRGPVKSVLLLCRKSLERLQGQTILVSAQTHTSFALLKILLKKMWKIDARFTTGNATQILKDGERPEAILAIGDEALNLRHHEDYPLTIDLGEAWRQQTGLPFIFGVWIVQKQTFANDPEKVRAACRLLAASKAVGKKNMDSICALAEKKSKMNQQELRDYFDGLVFDLGMEEKEGLERFYQELEDQGVIAKAPKIEILPM